MGQGSQIHVRVDNGCKVMVTGAKWHLLGQGVGVGAGQGYFPGEEMPTEFLSRKSLEVPKRGAEKVWPAHGTRGSKGQVWEERRD